MMLLDDELEVLWRPYRHELARTLELIGVLTLIKRALESSEIQVGDYPRGVEGLREVWSTDPDETITRIRREWIMLGRNPNRARSHSLRE